MFDFHLVLEVHQFSRDASVAEAWLLGQEPYLSSREIGQSVDEVEKLIKRHEAFEKSAATWDERFSALERLTTVSRNESVWVHSRNVKELLIAQSCVASTLSVWGTGADPVHHHHGEVGGRAVVLMCLFWLLHHSL